MTTTYVTEKELIDLTIEYGFDGSEFKTAAWKENKSLKRDGSQTALMKKALTIHESVELVKDKNGKALRGSKRRYALGKKRDVQLEREYNYNGRPLTEEDKTMKEYVFSQLLEINDTPHTRDTYSIKIWANMIKLYNRRASVKDTKELFSDYYYNKESTKVVRTFNERIESRVIDSVKLSISHLEKENRITTCEKYFAITSDGIKEIQKEFFDVIKLFLTKELAYYDVKYDDYKNAKIRKYNVSSNLEDVINKVDKELEDTYDIIKIFTGIKIEIIDNEIVREVSQNESNKAFINKLVKLTHDSQNKKERKEEYTASGFIEKEFHNFNVFLILRDVFGVTGLDDDIKRLEPKEEQIEDIRYIKKKFAEEKNRLWWNENSGWKV
jgi:hypothetical protein